MNARWLLFFLLTGQSWSAMANVCQQPMQNLVDQDNQYAGAEFQDPEFITYENAIELVEGNNTDLSENEVNSILVLALKKDPNIEFYLINVDSMGGSGADLLAVNISDCTVKIRLGIFED